MARSSSVNVLIIDDDRSTQRVLADALTKQGFVVTVERDGEWGVKTFEKKQFDVVILDILLPALNGYEVARQMKASPRGKRVPIIMISGVYKNAIHQREAVQKHGAFAFVEKPLDLPSLYETLKRALDSRYPTPLAAKPAPPPAEDDSVTGEIMADLAQREEVAVVEQHSRSSTASQGQSVRGDLKKKSFAELLAETYRWRATGALLLRREKVKKIVYFREGTPELVKSNLLVECLGRILVREKMISEAECDESLKRMKATWRQQGTVLIEMGCISPHNLQYALHLQLQEKLYDVFRWDSGDYQFNPKVTMPAEPVSLGMTCAQLIHEGVHRAYDAKRLARALGGVDDKYVHASEEPLYALQDAGLGEEEKELLLLADGHKTVATLRALGLLPPLDTDRLLFAMKCAQMVELRDEPAKGKPKASIARLAESMKPPPERHAPPPPSAKPPPLPPTSKASVPAVARPPREPPLPMPWDGAQLAQPMAPPPPPEESAPRGKRKKEEAPARSASLMPELSGVVSTRKLSSDESQARERLAAKVSAMRRLDYFEVLGVKPNASREDVKRAYFALAKEYHPDKHSESASAEIRALAQQLYDLISQAHDTLTDPAERERYLKQVREGVKPDMGADVGKILAAEGKFQKGEELMRDRAFAEAYKQFLEAIALYPDEGEFHAWQGWALFQVDPKNADGAIQSIEKAISLNPKLDKSYLFLGYIQKATGRADKAEKQFEKAIQCNPDCTEALRELRLLGKSKK